MDCTIKVPDHWILVDNMNSYFKDQPPNSSIFSEDNCEFQIHNEILYQTPFMREMVKSVNRDCTDLQIAIFCPLVSKDELKIIVNFLYSGKILCANGTMGSQIEKLLTELFGFPSISFNQKSETILEKHQVKEFITLCQENDYNGAGGQIKVEMKTPDINMVSFKLWLVSPQNKPSIRVCMK